MRTIGILLLVGIFLKSLLLYKTSRAVPLHELRRRARTSHDRRTQALYKLLAFQTSLNIVLWLVGGVSGAVLFLLAIQFSWWLGLAFVLVVTGLIMTSSLAVVPGSWLWKVSGFVAPAATSVLSFLQPVFGRIDRHLGHPTFHSGVYEREDLLDLLARQGSQIDNRITDRELKVAKGALTFGDKTVASVMIPRKAVEWVNRDDSIGPKLMDDLHKTGLVRFPVITGSSKPVNPEVVGTLYLNDLLKNLEKSGKIGDIMKKDAHFINESHTLLQALDGFLKSGQHLLIVVNNFEEVVGALTLEDVLAQILGEKISDEFGRYDNLHAVAGHESKKEHSHGKTSEVE